MKTLLIAEKPSVGKDFANALTDSYVEHKGYLESDDLVITWAVGHLLTLAEPDAYDKKLKRWKLDDLPIVPDKFQLKENDNSGQLKIVLKQIARSDIDRIVNGCDAGREGELIFAWLYQESGSNKPVERLWLSSLTKKAIEEAWADLHPASDYAGLEAAARCRAQADWVVGMNATRAATIHLRSSFDGAVSLGRVQTPTLAILAEREEEIRAFKPEDYWIIESDFKTDDGKEWRGRWHDGKEEQLDKKADAEKIVKDCAGQTGEVKEVKKRTRREKPPLLHDLTSLQREAGSRYGFSAKRTASAAQRLYEAHKAISYPRTSSRYLSKDVHDEVKTIAKGIEPQFGEHADYVIGLKAVPTERIIGKVTDHHAIIPTGEKVAANSWSEDEKKIFSLVACRFLAVFHPEAVIDGTRIETEVAGNLFYARGSILREAGWKAVYGKLPAVEGEKGDKELPDLEEGEEAPVEKVEFIEKQTTPPKRYSDASLLGAMETAGKQIDDEALREAMKEGGLGTPATRASIIETLITRDFVFRDGRSLHVTDKGLQVIRLLKDNPLTKPELTGSWEERLNQMVADEALKDPFMDDIKTFADETIKSLDKVLAGVKIDRANLGPCPVCSKDIIENRRGYSCWSKDDPGCGFVIWKKMASRNLPEKTVRELIQTGKTEKKVTGFKGRKGRSFSAHLALQQGDDGKWKVNFNEDWAKQPKEEASEEAVEEKV